MYLILLVVQSYTFTLWQNSSPSTIEQQVEKVLQFYIN